MISEEACILIINGGSSTIRFALYIADETISRLLQGKIDRIGSPLSTLTYNFDSEELSNSILVQAPDHSAAAVLLINWLEKQVDFGKVKAVAHRIVYGMHHSSPEYISAQMLDELRQFTSYDPNHLPNEIELIDTFTKHYPALLQVACFDSSFHAEMPRVARQFPIPRRFDEKGIQRYGFHGISYSFIMQELTQIEDSNVVAGQLILAHLGNGASMVAVNNGKSMDTTMGFTPTGGMIMGTRSGDLDPGVAWYMMQSEHLNPDQFNQLINHASGLLGVSDTTADMHDLLGKATSDFRAEEAVSLFCYQAKKWIGALAAVLNGVDMLVFTGGIGENSP